MKVLFDGSNLLHRNFHAFPNLTSKSGIPTGAIYGTVKMLKALNERFQPELEIFFTDFSRKSFRTDLYPEYKGNRSETDPALKSQFATMELFCEKANMLCCKKENYEADDLIGTYAKFYADKGEDVYIVSGDKDLFQLITDKITLVYSSTKDGFVCYNPEKCKEKFGLYPKQIIDLKAICGDASDNYKGIPGVGEKTATKLLLQYGDIDGIYEHIDDLKGKTKEMFEQNKEIAYLCRTLATINCNVPDIEPITDSLLSFNPDAINFLNDLDIRHF